MQQNWKAWKRQTAEILIQEAIELDGVKVRYLPSFRTVQCGHCGHAGRARIPHKTAAPRFKCSRCGKRS